MVTDQNQPIVSKKPQPLHFVIFRKTGVGIFSKTFLAAKEKGDIQETLFSGLLSGIMTFADEMIGGQINTLKIENKYVILEGTDSDIVFCLVATSNNEAIRELLSDIETRFQLRFGELSKLGFEFKKEALKSFDQELDRMVERWEKDIAKLLFVKGIPLCNTEKRIDQSLAFELSLAFSLAQKNRKLVKKSMFRKVEEIPKQLIRFAIPYNIIPINESDFIITSNYFNVESDIYTANSSQVEKLLNKIESESNIISLLKTTIFQTNLPQQMRKLEVGSLKLREEFKLFIDSITSIPLWNSIKLPLKNETDLKKHIIESINSVFQSNEKSRLLVVELKNLLLNRFKRYEQDSRQELLELEGKYRKEREKLVVEVDSKVEEIFRKQKVKKQRFQQEEDIELRNEKLAALDYEIDPQIEAQESRLQKLDQMTKGHINSIQSHLEDGRLLLRNLEMWNEDVVKTLTNLDKNIKSSFIPPKQVLSIPHIQEQNDSEAIIKDGTIHFWIPFYLVTFSSNGDKRDYLITPGYEMKKSEDDKFLFWEELRSEIHSVWDNISNDPGILRKLENKNLLNSEDARGLILDGLRLLNKEGFLDKKEFEYLTDSCRIAFQDIAYTG